MRLSPALMEAVRARAQAVGLSLASYVRAVLEAAFAENPSARSYVLDDQGALRKHINIFVDGSLIRDRVGLTDPVAPEAAVHVIQALSGG